MSGVVVGIDASRNRSGGAKAHLIGVLGAGNPSRYGISRVHVWSYQGLLDALPDYPWIQKHAPSELQGSLLSEAWWQWRHMPQTVIGAGCGVLLSLDAGTIGTFRPGVVMSRDMLSFEPAEIVRYRLSAMRARLILLRHLQVRSLRRADGALFLTEYAARVIQTYSGPLTQVRVIPHGIGETFRAAAPRGDWPNEKRRIECVYVSNADLYKHQWHVVHALARLRNEGLPLFLKLVGGGHGAGLQRMESAINEVDPRREFVQVVGAIPHSAIPAELASADLFIFASSCENMPNTLVEAMAAGLPIACAERGPMPEILRDGGCYFDPENPQSIAVSVKRLVTQPEVRRRFAVRAYEIARGYSWARCAEETWRYLVDVHAAHTALR